MASGLQEPFQFFWFDIFRFVYIEIFIRSNNLKHSYSLLCQLFRLFKKLFLLLYFQRGHLQSNKPLFATRSMQIESTQFGWGHFGRTNTTDWSVLLPLSLHWTVCTHYEFAVRGHSITTWKRTGREGGRRMSTLLHKSY